MQDPVTKLGIIRRITYFPDRRLLRAVTSDGCVHEVKGIDPARVEAAQPFEDPTNVERLVDQAMPWRRVKGTPPAAPRPLRPPVPPSQRAVARGGGRRMMGRFLSPLGLVQSVTYDRSRGRLRLVLADGERFESAWVAPEKARSLAPVRTRSQFDRLFGAGGEWRRQEDLVQP